MHLDCVKKHRLCVIEGMVIYLLCVELGCDAVLSDVLTEGTVACSHDRYVCSDYGGDHVF